MRIRHACFAALALLVLPAAPIAAQGAAGGTRDARDIGGAPAAPVVGPLTSINLVPGPPNLSANGSLPVTVTSAGVPTASLALSCALSGTDAAAFSILSGATQTLVAPAALGAATPISVRCTRAVQDLVASLTCTQSAVPTPNPPNLTATLTCPGTGGTPNPGTNPPAPGPIAVSGPPNVAASAPLVFTNIAGLVPYSVLSCTPSAGYTATATFPLAVPAGGSSTIAVGCTTPSAPGATGTPGTLACVTSAVGFNPQFTTTCSANVVVGPPTATAVPFLGPTGKLLAILLLLGLGMLALARPRWSG